jgi:hypothetical protein
MPPRRRTAVLWASLVSCCAVSPWMAFLSRAWPRPNARPARAQRSARQVPRAEAVDAADARFPVGRHGLEPWCGSCLQRPVPHHRTVLLPDTAIHGAGGHVEATVTWVWWSVEAPAVSSASLAQVPRASSPMVVCRGGGLQKYQTAAGDAPTAARGCCLTR